MERRTDDDVWIQNVGKVVSDYTFSLYGTSSDDLEREIRTSLTDSCRKYNIIRKNERYVSSYHNMVNVDRDFYVFVKSQMGTGKTYQFKRFLEVMKNNELRNGQILRCLILSPRRTFTKFITQELLESGFQSYMDITGSLNHIDHPRLVVQIQSLRRFKSIAESTDWAQYNLLFIDEFDSVCKELLAETCTKAEKLNNILYFTKLLNSVRKVVAMDANLSAKHVELMNEFVTNRIPFTVYINDYKGGASANATIKLYPCNYYNSFINRMLNKEVKAMFKDIAHLVDTCCVQDFFQSYREPSLMEMYKQKYISYLQEFDRPYKRKNVDIIYAMYCELMSGYNVAFVSTTKKQAMAVIDLFNDLLPEINSKLIAGGRLEEELHNLGNINEYARQFQLFGYTSALKVGVDISARHFNSMYVFLDLSTYNIPSVSDMFQCVGRVRNLYSGKINVAVVVDINKENLESTLATVEKVFTTSSANNCLTKKSKRDCPYAVSGLLTQIAVGERIFNEYPLAYATALIDHIAVMNAGNIVNVKEERGSVLSMMYDNFVFKNDYQMSIKEFCALDGDYVLNFMRAKKKNLWDFLRKETELNREAMQEIMCVYDHKKRQRFDYSNDRWISVVYKFCSLMKSTSGVNLLYTFHDFHNNPAMSRAYTTIKQNMVTEDDYVVRISDDAEHCEWSIDSFIDTPIRIVKRPNNESVDDFFDLMVKHFIGDEDRTHDNECSRWDDHKLNFIQELFRQHYGQGSDIGKPKRLKKLKCLLTTFLEFLRVGSVYEFTDFRPTYDEISLAKFCQQYEKAIKKLYLLFVRYHCSDTATTSDLFKALMKKMYGISFSTKSVNKSTNVNNDQEEEIVQCSSNGKSKKRRKNLTAHKQVKITYADLSNIAYYRDNIDTNAIIMMLMQ